MMARYLTIFPVFCLPRSMLMPGVRYCSYLSFTYNPDPGTLEQSGGNPPAADESLLSTVGIIPQVDLADPARGAAFFENRPFAAAQACYFKALPRPMEKRPGCLQAVAILQICVLVQKCLTVPMHKSTWSPGGR
jgi:hypothetical protein